MKRIFLSLVSVVCLSGPAWAAPSSSTATPPAIAVDIEKTNVSPKLTLERAKRVLASAGVKNIQQKGWAIFAFKDGYSLLVRVLPDEKNYIIVVSGSHLKVGMEILAGFKKNFSKAKI